MMLVRLCSSAFLTAAIAATMIMLAVVKGDTTTTEPSSASEIEWTRHVIEDTIKFNSNDDLLTTSISANGCRLVHLSHGENNRGTVLIFDRDPDDGSYKFSLDLMVILVCCIGVCAGGGQELFSVALTPDGGTMAVGVEDERNGSDWPRLVAVAISADGMRVALGSPDALSSAGAVEVYDRIPGTTNWQMTGGGPIDGTDEERFGTSVAMPVDGNRIIVGMPRYSPDVTKAKAGHMM